MGIGAAMAGGNPRDGREDRDFYPTPIDVTLALLEAETFGPRVLEPACGDGAIARILEGRGHTVIGTDIEPLGYGERRDFYELEEDLEADLVTNPPFDQAARFIRHARETIKPRKMALLLKSTFFHAKTRRPLFEEHTPSAVYPLTWRPDFMNKGRPVLEVAWFVWTRGSNGYPSYRPLPRPPGFTNGGRGRGKGQGKGTAPRATSSPLDQASLSL